MNFEQLTSSVDRTPSLSVTDGWADGIVESLENLDDAGWFIGALFALIAGAGAGFVLGKASRR